jgi:acyl-CoA thioesterase I
MSVYKSSDLKVSRKGQQNVSYSMDMWEWMVHWMLVVGLSFFSLQAGAAKSATTSKPSPVILIVGDSLSAEYGIRRGSGWVSLLSSKLQQEMPTARVVNASISGDTTSGGRSRLPALLARHQPTHVILELGANDALRGMPLKASEDNLTQMVKVSKKVGAQVLILGMQLPPNYGSRYAQQFGQLFINVAQKEKTALVPFFLSQVADVAQSQDLFLNDQLHPNEKAQPILLNNVWGVLETILK